MDSVVDDARAFHARPGRMTDPGRHPALFDGLPPGPAALAAMVQGLLLHEHLAPIYDVTLTPERRAGSHIRSTEAMLDAILALDPRPLSAPRPLEKRLVGTCRNFSVLLVAMLRAQGVAARARCGFAGYFDRETMIDHWVAETWDEREGRWRLVDAQLDPRARAVLHIPFDPLDVPRDGFLVAGDAWAACRAGADDAGRYGIFEMRGDWFIAGNVVRDAAALNAVEMLPWDDWGAMPRPDAPVPADAAAWLDRLADATRRPDAAWAELRARYAGDGLRVPPSVFNAVRQVQEAV